MCGERRNGPAAKHSLAPFRLRMKPCFINACLHPCRLRLDIGPWRRDELFPQWRKDMAELARCQNVNLKLGGLAMPDNGFGWHETSTPPDSDEFVAAQKRWYLHAIDCFGPKRCMFESNFPVDRLSIG